MGKWGYLARAYAIKEYAELRCIEAENVRDRTDEQADTITEVLNDIEIVLEIAEDNEDKRTIKQCRKFLDDFSRHA